MHNKNRIAQNFADGLMESVKYAIDNGYTDLLSTINSGMNLLFWEIGAQLNNSSEDSSRIANDFLSEYSNQLAPIFGNYLNAQNLSLMKVFAEKCSVSTVGQLSDVINWKYIPHLLELDGEKEWLFYMKLIEVAALSPIKLKNEISKKAVENKDIDEEKVLDRSNLKSLYLSSYQLYFGENNGEVFRKLFEPRAADDKEITSFLSKQYTDKTIMNIYELIIQFQSETHYVLNMQFNMLMCSIGGAIIRLSIRLNVSSAESINKCVQEFGVYFPSLFNQEELSSCIKLAEQYKEPSDIMKVAEIITWPHIKVLLQIKDIEKQHFIAKQVLNNGITIQKLKPMVTNNSFDFKNLDSSYSKPLNHNSITSETKIGNNVTSTTEHLMIPILHPVHDLNRNIYKIPELLAFLSNNTFGLK